MSIRPEIDDVAPYKERSGYLENEDGQIVCILPDEVEPVTVGMLKNSPVMYAAISDFVEEVDKGSLRAKKAYDRFQDILKDVHK